jgi:hypothetical protein
MGMKGMCHIGWHDQHFPCFYRLFLSSDRYFSLTIQDIYKGIKGGRMLT